MSDGVEVLRVQASHMGTSPLPEGHYVRAADYAALRAECEALRTGIQRIVWEHDEHIVPEIGAMLSVDAARDLLASPHPGAGLVEELAELRAIACLVRDDKMQITALQEQLAAAQAEEEVSRAASTAEHEAHDKTREQHKVLLMRAGAMLSGEPAADLVERQLPPEHEDTLDRLQEANARLDAVEEVCNAWPGSEVADAVLEALAASQPRGAGEAEATVPQWCPFCGEPHGVQTKQPEAHREGGQ